MYAFYRDAKFQNETFQFEGGNFSWLNKCVAITPYGFRKGSCDDYGRLEHAEGTVCVMHTNWGPLPKLKKPWEADDDGDDELPGILLHEECWRIMLETHPTLKKAPIRELFKTFSSLLPNYGQCLVGIDYGHIVANQGQDYNLRSGEAELITFPKSICLLQKLHRDNIEELALLSGELLCTYRLKSL